MTVSSGSTSVGEGWMGGGLGQMSRRDFAVDNYATVGLPYKPSLEVTFCYWSFVCRLD